MNVEELAGIPIWVEKEIVSRKIPQLYSSLASAVQSNAYGSPQAYESRREILINELREINTAELTSAQERFLSSKLNLLGHVGENGVDELESVLFRNALDIVTAAEEISRISAEIESAVSQVEQIQSALEGLVEPFETLSEEIQIRIVFDRDASIKDVVDLKKWASDWFDIGRGISMAVGEKPEDVRVVGAQSGSVIITVATTLAIARVIASIVLKSLEVAEKVQGLRKAELEIKALKLSNDAAVKAIREQAEVEKKAGLENITISITASLPGLDGEKANALEKAVSKFLHFIHKGGEVDVVLPPSSAKENDPPSALRDLKNDVERIRELEREMKQLPPPLTDSDEQPINP